MGGLLNPFTFHTIYDDLNRLLSAEETVGGSTTWKQSFVYDRFGNRTIDAENTTTLSVSNTVTNPAIDPTTNRFASGQNYSYDKAGNLTNDAEGREFLYDAENHQIEVKNAAQQTIGVYEFDGEGRRVRKISSTEMTVFVYNAAGKLIAEYSTQMAQVQQVSYLTNDHLGSPRVITNGSGAVTSRQDFSAFGDETLTVQRTQGLGYKPDELRKDYTGYEKDDETGLEFAQARYYNPKHGRFTSVDPLTASANVKDPQTFNRYSYALNSPYKFTDPLGLISEDTGANGSNCRQCIGGGFDGGTDFDLTASYKYNALYFDGEDIRGVAAAMRSRREGAAQQAARSRVVAAFLNSNATDFRQTSIQVFVVSNVDELEKNAQQGNGWGYQDSEGIYQCARLPQAWQNEQEGYIGQRLNRDNRLSENWIMGDAVADGKSITKGTVLATFNRETGKYAQTNAGEGGNNHTVVFLEWKTIDNVKGMRVVEQRSGPAKIAFIPFNSSADYANDAGKFNIVKTRVRTFSPNFIDNPTRRTVMR